MEACHSRGPAFVERVAAILSPGLKDAMRAAERGSEATSADGTNEVVTVPGVAYGEVATNEETLKYTFTMHCSGLFRQIRSFFRVPDEEFRGSLCSHRSIKGGLIGEGGQSGSVFFFSKDRKFALKTLRPYELDLLRSLLPDYLEHLQQDNFFTLLPRFFGLCTIRVEGAAPLHLVIMNNVFYINRPLALKFDLKGASAGRYVQDDGSGGGGGGRPAGSGDASGGVNSNVVVLKDHNFSARGLHHESRGEYSYPVANHKLSVGGKTRESLLAQLGRDTHWLEEHNLIDYSFLVGVIDDFAPKPQTFSNLPPPSTVLDTSLEGGNGTVPPFPPSSSASVASAAAAAASSFGSRAASYMNKLVVAASSGKAADDRRSSWSLSAVHSSSDVTTLYEGDRNIGIDPIVIPAVGRGEIYVLGIVDILQQFTCRKKTECCLKQFGAVLRGGHPQCMSIIPAADYANRLRNYIDKNIE
jgi:hypothetical protein